MLNIKKESIKEEFEKLKYYYYTLRSFFPYIDEKLVGKKTINKMPIFSLEGINVSFKFSKSLTWDTANHLNRVGHYINQNFIVRLFSMLNDYEIVPFGKSVNPNIRGSKGVAILKKLRHIFAHTSGKYDRTDDREDKENNKFNQKGTMDELLKYCTKLEKKEYPDWPLAIDTVIEPLFEACIEYINDKYQKQNP